MFDDDNCSVRELRDDQPSFRKNILVLPFSKSQVVNGSGDRDGSAFSFLGLPLEGDSAIALVTGTK